MRVKLLGMALAAATLMAGCKPPPKEQTVKAFIKELHLYFNNLNNEGLARKDDLKKAGVALGITPATGVIYSTYTWDENAFIVKNYKCQVCETRLLITNPATEYLCPSCHHCPYIEHPKIFNRKESPCKLCVGVDGKPHEPAAALITPEALAKDGAVVQKMFDIVDDSPGKPFKAWVRYVRRQWALDTRGTIEVSSKALERAVVPGTDAMSLASYIPTDQQGGKSPGFHRPDATFVGEIEFAFTGGELVMKSRKLEDPVRPWKDLLGNP